MGHLVSVAFIIYPYRHHLAGDAGRQEADIADAMGNLDGGKAVKGVAVDTLDAVFF
jgi:hypothetical protein